MMGTWFARVGLASLVVLLMTGGIASADPANGTSARLRAAVSAAGIMEHERALGGIADEAGGNRLAGTQGHDDSAQYVADRAAAAGMEVSFQDFDYDLDFLADLTPPVLEVVSGGPVREFVPGIAGASLGGDFGSMFNSTSDDFEARSGRSTSTSTRPRRSTPAPAAASPPTTTGCRTARSRSSSGGRARSPRSSNWRTARARAA